MTVRVVDRGAVAVLRAAALSRVPIEVRVGIMGDEAGEDHGGLTNADLAEIHEFGIGVPSRSWLRGYVDENAAKTSTRLRAIATAVVKRGLPLEPGLEQLGGLIAGEIKGRIDMGIDPPLSEATIARKGSSKQLIDTGQLKSSITFLVGPKQ